MIRRPFLIAGFVMLGAIGCSKADPTSSPVVQTGSLEAESQFGASAVIAPKDGEILFVASDQLKLRSRPDVSGVELRLLQMNDRVQVRSATSTGSEKFIRVKIESTSNAQLANVEGYVSLNYLGPQPVKKLSEMSGDTKSNFVIVNVATEVVRLYHRCKPDEGCKNKMLMEFKGTVGDDSEGMRSDVGVYETTSWSKFYESGPYAGFFREDYPELPKKGARGEWIGKARPPGKSGPRGAFGWYTVKIGPKPNGQWMHGTIGWGADKEKFVRFQDSFLGALASIFTKLGSHGCTRLSNEAIAYLRTQLPVGAPFIKIYAKEAVADQRLTGYPSERELGRFDYVLTKLAPGEVNSRHDLPSREAVLQAGTPESEWLEQGTYFFDQTPNARSGDHYGLGKSKFSGLFIVDQGVISDDYVHPTDARLQIGGFTAGFPDFVRTSNIPR